MKYQNAIILHADTDQLKDIMGSLNKYAKKSSDFRLFSVTRAYDNLDFFQPFLPVGFVNSYNLYYFIFTSDGAFPALGIPAWEGLEYIRVSQELAMGSEYELFTHLGYHGVIGNSNDSLGDAIRKVIMVMTPQIESWGWTNGNKLQSMQSFDMRIIATLDEIEIKLDKGLGDIRDYHNLGSLWGETKLQIVKQKAVKLMDRWLHEYLVEGAVGSKYPELQIALYNRYELLTKHYLRNASAESVRRQVERIGFDNTVMLSTYHQITSAMFKDYGKNDVLRLARYHHAISGVPTDSYLSMFTKLHNVIPPSLLPDVKGISVHDFIEEWKIFHEYVRISQGKLGSTIPPVQ